MKVLIYTFIIVIMDQLTKLLIKGFSIPFLNISHKGMELNSNFDIISSFLKITYVENPGMAFGLDFGGKLFFSLFSILASIGIFIYIFKVRHEKLFLRIPLAFILGGAIGNLIDRVFYGVIFNEGKLFYGKVVDFIHITFVKVDFFGIHLNGWPIFNVSDMAVTIGVLLLIIFHKKISVSTEEDIHTPVNNSIPELSNQEQTVGLSSEKTVK